MNSSSPRLLYIANIRLPTEKAHGLQIMQNCEALADAGAEVTLWVARRFNTPELSAISDPWVYYGVQRNFTLRYLPCIDPIGLVPPGCADWRAKLVFHIQQLTFLLAVLISVLLTSADIYYSRDRIVLLALSWLKPRRKLVYEAHTLSPSGAGRRLQRWTVGRVGSIIPVTPKLRDDLVALVGAENTDPARFLVAHDGIRRERFANLPTQAAARAAIGWPAEAFIVGYIGRLHTMKMDKGVGTLIEALAQVGDVALALVGGPDDMAEAFRQQWLDLGLDAEHFLYAGHVLPERLPLYLSAFDVCAMPFPWTEHFAYYASPIKLFEYMASGRVVVATDLPSTAAIVTYNESAYLVPPSDVPALASAITHLRDDPALRDRLATNAHKIVLAEYTWEARAQAILTHSLQRARDVS